MNITLYPERFKTITCTNKLIKKVLLRSAKGADVCFLIEFNLT